MKPHPKIRKTIKWGGAAVTVLLVVVWVGSGWLGFQWRGASGYITFVTAGRWCLNWLPPNPGNSPYYGWSWGANASGGFDWWGHWLRSGQYMFFAVPLWIPILPFGLAVATTWRLDTFARRRAKLNVCPACKYDRTGLLKNAKCPECGAVPDSV